MRPVFRFLPLALLILCEHQCVFAQPSHVYNGRAVGDNFFQAMSCGRELCGRGKYRDANAQFVKATILSPNNPDALAYCAETFNRMGKFNEAFNFYQRLARIEPKNEDALFNCADTLMKAGRAADALQFYRKIIAVNPRDEAAYLSCSHCYESLHRHKEALAVLRKLTAVNQDSVRGLEESGRILLLINKPHEAIQNFNKASALSNDETIWFQWSTALVMLGEFDESINICKEFQRRLPQLEKANDEMQKRINILRENEAKGSSAPSDSSNKSYVNEVTVRHLECAMPIPVYIAPGLGVKHWTPILDKALKHAFSTWTKSSTNLVTFKFVDKPQAAQIICSWTANSADMHKYSLGVTNFESCSGSSYNRAQVKIFTAGFKSAPSPSDIEKIAIHEIGHALGIDGHSGIPSDAMYYSRELNGSEDDSVFSQALSERDVSTLREVYGSTKTKPTSASSKSSTRGAN